jgi:hypothetical protein
VLGSAGHAAKQGRAHAVAGSSAVNADTRMLTATYVWSPLHEQFGSFCSSGTQAAAPCAIESASQLNIQLVVRGLDIS